MVLVKNRSCDVNILTIFIKSYIPKAILESQVCAEVTYLLPFSESKKFETLFTELEEKMEELGIESFGVTATTMEEVFLK